MLSLLGSLRGGSSFITNSLRFRSSASAYLNRTFGADVPTYTLSLWCKRGALGTTSQIAGSRLAGVASNIIAFDSSDRLYFEAFNTAIFTSTAVFRDPSAWYHVVLRVTQSGTAFGYVNNIQVASGSVGLNSALFKTGYTNVFGRAGDLNSSYFDGYLTEVNFIDGQALTPASFGAIDSSTGVWAPRPYSGTYGTNGFYLKFANTSSVAALGNDSSGNNNTWTVNNVSLTAGATYDSMIDVPVNYSDGGNGRGNYCTLNPLDKNLSSITVLNGNLDISTSASNVGVAGTLGVSAGKWYWETTFTNASGAPSIGAAPATWNKAFVGSGGGGGIGYHSNGIIYNNGAQAQIGLASYTSGDIIGVALDIGVGSITFYKNNVQIGTTITGLTGEWFPAVAGQISSTLSANFGQRPFTYTPPAGFRALNTNNLPTPSIVNGANFMAATTYTGNAAARSLSNAVNSVSFQPDLVWIKSRTPGATNHALFDSSRGVTKYLSSNTTTAETTLAQSLTAFNSNGFSLGTDTTLVNASANSYVAWQWKESIAAGLDIVTYTGNGANRTIAHNLGVAPAMVIVKRYDAPNTGNWQVRHTSIAAANSIQLNATSNAAAAATVWNSTAPTSSVFSVGTSTDVNATGGTYVAYCFAETAGFSKFGSYTGNGSNDGPFVFCGFRPRFIMIKVTNGSNDWRMFDTSRSGLNAAKNSLLANLADTEDTVFNATDILSNGFKLRTGDNSTNISGGTFIFMAFAEVPSKYALAR
jgi:hypothetical protein